MEHRNISLFRGYSDTESVETSLEEIVNIIKCDAALRDRTEKHRYYLQQDLRRDADREKSGCPCFAVAVCFEGGKTREHICAWTGYTLVDLDHIAPERMAATLTLICADKYTLMAYTTISGHGIRIICRIDDLNGAEKGKAFRQYAKYFNQVNDYYSCLVGFESDGQCKNATRISGLASDPHVYYNPSAASFVLQDSPIAPQPQDGASEAVPTKRNKRLEKVVKAAERLLEEPVEVSATPSTRERKKIHQWYYRADDIEHKTALLIHLLKQPEATRSIVFVRKRERVHELAAKLHEAGINTCWLEGEMVQIKRNEAIKRLTDGRVNVLIATDVAARGIDIPDVSHVFNFDMPRSGDAYLHRIGRTGRAGRKGTAISLVEAHDHLLLGKASRYIDEPLKARVIDELRPTTRAPSEKSNGKPSKKVLAKRAEQKAKEKEKPRVKKRHRDAKNIGKRRKPSGAATQQSDKE